MTDITTQPILCDYCHKPAEYIATAYTLGKDQITYTSGNIAEDFTRPVLYPLCATCAETPLEPIGHVIYRVHYILTIVARLDQIKTCTMAQ
jgi:hypothetical protein